MPEGQNPAEEAVEIVLKKLKELRLIKHYLRNKQNDRLDQEGIDFLIIQNDGRSLPLQVKTWSGNRFDGKKFREHIRKHPHVTSIIFVNIHQPPEIVSKWVEQKLRRMLSKGLKAS